MGEATRIYGNVHAKLNFDPGISSNVDPNLVAQCCKMYIALHAKFTNFVFVIMYY